MPAVLQVLGALAKHADLFSLLIEALETGAVDKTRLMADIKIAMVDASDLTFKAQLKARRKQ
jgi:hypothetical protein